MHPMLTTAVKAARRAGGLIESKRAGSLKCLDIMDRELAKRPFLAGDTYTIADISAFAYVHRADEADLPLQNFRNVLAWIERVRSQPRFLDK
ncbi:MAG: glutathione S-transferase C-terminal domain-containing protein, partial [Nitrosospira sp.]|nr:glutathione S-transferase C-terminal domain-containing protein [Nitrosospira sp.]